MNRFSRENTRTFEIQEWPSIDLDSTYVDGKRYYQTPDGKLYPSVTTVLSSMKDKAFLDEWRKKVGNKQADRLSRRATTRGTDMHLICENYLRNHPYPMGKSMPMAIEMFNNIRPVIDENVEIVYGNELALFSHTLKTAGRTDAFCRFQGMNTIVDFKTSNKDKKEEWIEDYFIQSTVYAIMLEEMYSDVKKVHIPQIAIIIAVESGESKYQLFVKRTEQYRDKARELFASYHEKHTLPELTTRSIID